MGRRRRAVAFTLVGTAAAASLTALPAGPAAAKGGPPTGTVAIKVANFHGSGCRKPDTTVALSPDRTAFTVVYSDYTAEVGPGNKGAAATADCTLMLNVTVPKGYTYTIDGVEYRGFADLKAGATGKLTASYAFASGEPVSVTHQVPVPLYGDWEFPDSDTGVYEPCDKHRPLTVHTELDATAGTSDPSSTSILAMDSTDGTVVGTTYHLAWQTC